MSNAPTRALPRFVCLAEPARLPQRVRHEAKRALAATFGCKVGR
jgi:hypothetical protein